MVIVLLIILLAVCFTGVIFFGAPYLPTLHKQQDDVLDLLALKPGQTLIELGCGDGRMLRTAASKGLTVIGYELNPILVFVSYLVTYKYRKQVSVRWGNFWAKDWPPTDAIYVFLLDKYMKKLDKKIIQQYKGKHVKVVSYAFTIPTKKPIKTHEALFLYEYK